MFMKDSSGSDLVSIMNNCPGCRCPVMRCTCIPGAPSAFVHWLQNDSNLASTADTGSNAGGSGEIDSI